MSARTPSPRTRGSDLRRAHVVAALKSAGRAGVSGETLARELGISRAAVSKHVTALREAGYSIEAAPGAGYVLLSAPDLPLPSEVYPLIPDVDCTLTGGMVTGSTNDDAKALAVTGAPEGTVVLAAQQTAGKGRLGRTWVSPSGGLYFSLVLRPEIAPMSMSHLGLVLGLAVRRALVSFGCEDLWVKWPNDLLMNVGEKDRGEVPGKVCGILMEMFAQHDMVEAVIPGIGINVNRGEDAPPRSAYMSDAVGHVMLAEIAAAAIREVLGAYHTWCAGGYSFAPFRDEYLAHLAIMGMDVAVTNLDGSLIAEGKVTGVDDEGRLLVGDVPVFAGDVTLRR